MATYTLQARFRFYRERNAAPLAYYFARRKHASGYKVPDWLVMYVDDIGVRRCPYNVVAFEAGHVVV